MRTLVLIALLALLAVPACGPAPLVVQGKVVSYDTASRVVVVGDELKPGTTIALNIANAEVGAEPAVGDLLRLAYLDRDGVHVASRVMNITRQAELAKRGSGGH